MQAGVIVDVEATPAYRTDEVESAKTMVERVEDRFGLTPQRLIGDTAYGSAEMLGWIVDDKGIEPHVPVWDKSERNDGTFSRSDFAWEASKDRYICPSGKELLRYRYYPRGSGVTKDNAIIYRASKYDCQDCALKSRCCPNAPMRKVRRSIHEEARDVARRLRTTERYVRSRKERKKVEILFGHLKRILKLDRLRLRGLSGAHDEFVLAATAQNLRRMAMWLSTGPPACGVSAPG